MTCLGIFPREVTNIIFAWKGACEMRLNPCKVRLNIKTNIKMNIPAKGECGPDVGLGSRGWSGGGGTREPE